MHRLPTCQDQRPNVNGYDWCEVSHLSKPAPQCKRQWLMHKLLACQSQYPNVNGYNSCEVSYLSKPPPQCKRLWLMHKLLAGQSQRPNVNGYDWCEVSHLSRPAPQGKWPWLMHRLPTCQNQRPNVNGYEWCTHFFQKLHMNCARARISWFGPKKYEDTICWIHWRPQWILSKNDVRDVTSASWYDLSFSWRPPHVMWLLRRDVS